MFSFSNYRSILRSFMKTKTILVKNIIFALIFLFLGYFIVYILNTYRENMNGGDIKIDNPDGLFNFVDIFRSKPKPVEIEIDNTKTQQHIISIPDNSVTTTNNPSNNGVKFERKSPDFCKFEFGTSNQNIFEICPEDKPKCSGYEFTEDSWGKCVAE